MTLHIVWCSINLSNCIKEVAMHMYWEKTPKKQTIKTQQNQNQNKIRKKGFLNLFKLNPAIPIPWLLPKQKSAKMECLALQCL